MRMRTGAGMVSIKIGYFCNVRKKKKIVSTQSQDKMNSQVSKDWQLREMLGNNLEGLSNLVREILLGTDGFETSGIKKHGRLWTNQRVC